jgi:hypothetical protein
LEKYFLLFLAFNALNDKIVQENTRKKQLNATTVMTERHVLTYRCALKLNSVPNIVKVLTTLHWFRQNGTSKFGNSQNYYCTVVHSQSQCSYHKTLVEFVDAE